LKETALTCWALFLLFLDYSLWLLWLVRDWGVLDLGDEPQAVVVITGTIVQAKVEV
jgi:hypothetical protein